MGVNWRQFGLAFLVAAFASTLALANEDSQLERLDDFLSADWRGSDWVDDLLEHVDANLDPSIPLVDGGWTPALRHLAYDCWTREFGANGSVQLRDYKGCGASAGQVHLRMHDVVWVLIRHEWAANAASVGNQDGKVAAWTLEQAISEYKNLISRAEPRSVEPFATTLKRLRIVRGYVDELSRLDDGAYLTDLERQQIVRDEINRQLALDGTGSSGLDYGPYTSIVGPLKALTRDTMQTYLSGAEAEQDAKSLAALVYGNGSSIANLQGESLDKYLADGERKVLSLSSLKEDADLNQLYEFVRDAVVERPNAIGISERYATMKRRLTKNDIAEAQKLSAENIKLGWPSQLLPNVDGIPSEPIVNVTDLWFGDEVISVPVEEQPVFVGLDQACKLRSESDNPPTGRCTFKALADRTLRASSAEDFDPFEINAREVGILQKLDEVWQTLKKKDERPELQVLIESLVRQTGAKLEEDQPPQTDEMVYVLPYDARPNWFNKPPKGGTDPKTPFADAEFDKKVCLLNKEEADNDKVKNTNSVFWANNCTIDPDAFDEEERLPELLYARLSRLMTGKPTADFSAKIAGLKQMLADIDPDLVAEDTLVKPGDETESIVKEYSFINNICDQSVSMLPALAAVGLRDVRFPSGGLGDEGSHVCQ